MSRCDRSQYSFFIEEYGSQIAQLATPAGQDVSLAFSTGETLSMKLPPNGNGLEVLHADGAIVASCQFAGTTSRRRIEYKIHFPMQQMTSRLAALAALTWAIIYFYVPDEQVFGSRSGSLLCEPSICSYSFFGIARASVASTAANSMGAPEAPTSGGVRQLIGSLFSKLHF